MNAALDMSKLGEPLHASTLTIGQVKKNGAARINIENLKQLSDSGFVPGISFKFESRDNDVYALVASDAGTNVVVKKEFKTRASGVKIGSRVDVRRLEMADRVKQKYMVLYFDGLVLLMPPASTVNNIERINRLKNAYQTKQFNKIALYSGIGTLDASLHEGFEDVGIKTNLVAVNDNWDKAIDALINSNPAANKATRSYTMGIDELVALGRLPKDNIHMLVVGIPCKGASKLNVRDRDLPEMHPEAGHQILNLAMVLQMLEWKVPLILIENVLDWSNTVSCSMIERVFIEQGYDVSFVGKHIDDEYKGLTSSEYGELEKRTRMCMLAHPKGMPLDISVLDQHKRINTTTVGDVRLDESLVDPGEYDKGNNLDSEAKKAKGWKNRVVDNSDTVVPSTSASCYKQRPEDPKLKHPILNKTRLTMPEEHAAFKGTDTKLIDLLPFFTHAHTALGNGANRKMWHAVGAMIGVSINHYIESITNVVKKYSNAKVAKPIEQVEQMSLFAG